MNKTIAAALVVSFTAMASHALLVALDKVKIQYISEEELPTTVLEAGELVRVADDNSLVVGDGVRAGGYRLSKQWSEQTIAIPAETYYTGASNTVMNGQRFAEAATWSNENPPDEYTSPVNTILLETGINMDIPHDLVFSNDTHIFCRTGTGRTTQLEYGLSGQALVQSTTNASLTFLGSGQSIQGVFFGASLGGVYTEHGIAFKDCTFAVPELQHTGLSDSYPNGAYMLFEDCYIGGSLTNNGGIASAEFRNCHFGTLSKVCLGKGTWKTGWQNHFSDCYIATSMVPFIKKPAGPGGNAASFDHCRIIYSEDLFDTAVSAQVVAWNTDFGGDTWNWTVEDTSEFWNCKRVDAAVTNTAARVMNCTDTAGNIIPNQ